MSINTNIVYSEISKLRIEADLELPHHERSGRLKSICILVHTYALVYINPLWVWATWGILEAWIPFHIHMQAASQCFLEGDFTSSWDSLCQSSITCTAQKCCLAFSGNLLCSGFSHLFLFLAPGITEKSLLLSTIPSGIYRHSCDSSWASSSPDFFSGQSLIVEMLLQNMEISVLFST